MIDAVLDDARREGYHYVEAQWRVTNEQASSSGLATGYPHLRATRSLAHLSK